MATPYESIPDCREIVSRRSLEHALARLVEDRPAGDIPRPEVLALFRQALATGRAAIRRRFEGTAALRNDGPACLPYCPCARRHQWIDCARCRFPHIDACADVESTGPGFPCVPRGAPA